MKLLNYNLIGKFLFFQEKVNNYFHSRNNYSETEHVATIYSHLASGLWHLFRTFIIYWFDRFLHHCIQQSPNKLAFLPPFFAIISVELQFAIVRFFRVAAKQL